jgi:hypothetical protein
MEDYSCSVNLQFMLCALAYRVGCRLLRFPWYIFKERSYDHLVQQSFGYFSTMLKKCKNVIVVLSFYRLFRDGDDVGRFDVG